MNATVRNIMLAIFSVGITSCSTTDPEYQFANARVSNSEMPTNKIVGEWVSIQIHPWGEDKDAIKLISNGTGLKRSISKFNNGTGAITEQDLTWNYMGANAWQVRQGSPRIISGSCDFGLRIREPFTLRAYENSLLHSGGRVFVPMDDDAKVKAKLQQMRTEAIRQGT